MRVYKVNLELWIATFRETKNDILKVLIVTMTGLFCFCIICIIVQRAVTECNSAHVYKDETYSIDDEQWGYITVRQGAHMFWWLYHSNHQDGYENRPLIIWIQGGPGLSGTAIGNFAMFGPLDTSNEKRNTTWIQKANILYVDNPVGVGFSYFDENCANHSDNSEEIGTDLVSFLKGFLNIRNDFRNIPIFIFGQSYGGKMAVNFAYYLQQEIMAGSIDCNFKGVAIGNGWISPGDFMANYPNFLLQMSYMDENEYHNAKKIFEMVDDLAKNKYNGDLVALYNHFWKGLNTDICIYNIFKKMENSIYSALSLSNYEKFMMDLAKNKLKIIPENLEFGNGDKIYQAIQQSDMMLPVYDKIDRLLIESDVSVIVYNGQLDLICCTTGAMAWVKRLQWPGMKVYHEKKREVLYKPDLETENSTTAEMFVKAHDKFKFYWILNSGHVVPVDAPETALRMVDRILNDSDN